MRCVYMFIASSITVFYNFFFRPDDEVKSSKYIYCQNKYYIAEPPLLDCYIKTQCFYQIKYKNLVCSFKYFIAIIIYCFKKKR